MRRGSDSTISRGLSPFSPSRCPTEKAVVLSTHILEEVDAACTRAIIIDRGRIVANGTPAELKNLSECAGAVILSAQTTDDNGSIVVPVQGRRQRIGQPGVMRHGQHRPIR